MNKVLIKTDKNGTKYWAIPTCRRCGGQGGAESWRYTGYTCYRCGGSGLDPKPEVYKEYTPEHAAKLEAQRQKRAAKKLEEEKVHAAEKNTEFFKNNGFNEDGKTYYVLGNTYDIKEELKAQGAKWDSTARHWHMATKPEGREVVEVSVDEIYQADMAGAYSWNNYRWWNELEENYTDKIQAAENKLKAQDSPSEYVGQVGDKLEIVVTYIHTASWESNYGSYWSNNMTYLHSFKDEDGNVFTWKTGNCFEANYGDKVVLKGTVKEHNEYKGIKQTVMTRCKVEEVK